ncbi:hypothetical protein SPD48_07010 [Pseudogracilibacillus sp. SE30717A]|uniref:hypothetical protein n=1 Tax=Pseudogracilibacillus sp. SE30717A TaxID=3098293 RepID=UPI00300E4E73
MRRNAIALVYTCLILFILSAISVQAAIDPQEEDNSSFINSYEEDLTGDGFREYFTLNGTLLTDKSKFYRDVWLDISSPFSHQWKVSFEGGYDPDLQLIDLTHDQTFDLLYSVAKDENKHQFNYQLYTLKNNVVKQLPIPKHNHIQGKFINDFKIELQINPNMKPIIKDISNNKHSYIEEGLYEENGKLIEEKNLKIPPIEKLEPVLISKSKGYGLKSYQPIKGVNNEDVFGEIITLWYYQKDRWLVLQTDWIER